MASDFSVQKKLKFSLIFVFTIVHGSLAFTVTNVNQAAHAKARTELAELQPGVKYATNRGPYRFRHVPFSYRGAVYLRGDNDKSTAKTKFVVDVPVRVFVAVDTRRRRNTRAYPRGFRKASDWLVFTHNGRDAIHFDVYYKDFQPGLVSFSFRAVIMAGTFVMQLKGLPGPRLTYVRLAAAAHAPTQISRLQPGAFYKYATNRGRYSFSYIPAEFRNAIYLRGDNDKSSGPTFFFTNRPVTVYVALDTRFNRHIRVKPTGFQSSKANLIFSHNGVDIVPFAIYHRHFSAGYVGFRFRGTTMAGVFVQERKARPGVKPRPKECVAIQQYGLRRVCSLCARCDGPSGAGNPKIRPQKVTRG